MGMFDGKSEQELREKTWEFEEFQEYFRQEGKKWGNSSPFKAVVSAMESYRKLRREEITPESAVKIVTVNEAMIKACAEYKAYKEVQAVKKGKELSPGERRRLAVIDKLSEFQAAMNLDEARDLRVVRSLAGKTWEKAGAFKITEAVLEGKAEVKGANVSQRIRIDVDGRKGFFTENSAWTMDKEVFFDKLMNQTEDPERRLLFWQNHSIYQTLTKNDDAFPRSIAGDTWEMDSQIRYNLKEAIDKMAPDDRRRGAAALVNYNDSVRGFYQEIADKGLNEEEKKNVLDEYCRKIAGKKPHVADLMYQYGEILLDLPTPEPGKKISEYQMMMVKEAILDEKRELLESDRKILENRERNETEKPGKTEEDLRKNQERRSQLDRLAADNRGLHELNQVMAEATASELAMKNGDFYTGERILEDQRVYDKEVEAAARNIATSRFAELIGLGHLVAHSEKMVVKSGDKTMTGCFMEFAKGLDPASDDPETLKKFSQVEVKRNASFVRDMSNLDVLDFLCGQRDRHGYNMFYQLSEPDEYGKRNLIGLQGIDNDLAFGTRNLEDSDYLAALKGKRFFIDRDVAEQVRKLDGDTLNYALGDLLPQNQIEQVKKRIDYFKEYMKENMVELGKDEWDLNEYAVNTPLEGLDKRGQIYVKGLRSIENSTKNQEFLNYDQKYGHVQQVLREADKKRQAMENAQEQLYESVRDIFAEPEPKPQKETLAEAKESSAPPRRKVGFGELERQSAQERKGPTIGNNRAVPQKTAGHQQEKNAVPPQRTRMNFQSLAGKSTAEKNPAAKRSGITIGNHEKQTERKPEKGRSMG